MTLIVFNAGLRTTTPWYDIFPPKDVEPLQELKASETVEKHEPRSATFEQALQQTYTASKRQQKTDVYRAIEHPPKHYKQVHLASEIMTTDVITLSKLASINAAWQLVQRHRFRHIPVVEQDNTLCGLLSDRDILSHTSLIQAQSHHTHLTDSVDTIMTKQVLAGRPDSPIRVIAGALTGHRIGALPIIDASDTLVGIVTRSDVLKTLLHRVPVEAWS